MNRIILSLCGLIAAMALSVPSLAQEKTWANFARYASDNKAVLDAQAKGARRPLAVLMGDSITDGWLSSRGDFFKENNLVGRGISGQCTSHMLTRFQRDVVELRPNYVAILGGINDIAHNQNYCEPEEAVLNIVSMCDIAEKYGIKVILCTTTPGTPGWRKELKGMHECALWLNDQIRQLAKERKYILVDYAEALQDGNGFTSKEYSGDSIHPNAKGYEVMEGLLLKGLGKKK